MKTQLILFLALSFSNNLWSQQDTITQRLYSFVKNINTFNHLYPQEKVYLHFDNTGYFLGETIWFKAYVTTATDLKPSDLSKILYTELLTPEGKIMETKKLKLEDGQAHADFILKDSLYAGFYEVRAYTKSMLNFGEEVIFSRVFPVFDKPKEEGNYTNRKMTPRPVLKIMNTVREFPPKYPSFNIQFYPEGGNLVDGLSNKIAFKATGDKGQPIDTQGVIIDTDGKEITTFTTIHEGMGSFIIYPDGRKYTAIIKGDNKQYKFELPASTPIGYSLKVSNLQEDKLVVQINKTPNTPTKPLGISFVCRGKVYVFDVLELIDNEAFTLSIPKESLPSGIIQITLFDAQGQIFGERLAFPNHGTTPISIKTDIKTDYKPLSPVRIDFEATDNQDQPIATTFSLSVRDEDSDIPSNYTNNMQIDMLLTSDLKGYINNAAYYFEKDDVRHRLALDLLLLTQGWRRYQWKQMAGTETFDVKHGIEKGLTVDGQILSNYKKKAEENFDVTMWMLTPYQKGTCKTDSLGKFNLMLDDFFERQDFTIEARKDGELKWCRILLNSVLKPTPKYYSYAESLVSLFDKKEKTKGDKELKFVRLDTSDIVYANDTMTTAHVLKEVVIIEKKKKSLSEIVLEDAVEVLDIRQTFDDMKDQAEFETDNIIEFLDRYYPKQFKMDVGTTETLGISYLYNKRKVSVKFRLKGMPLPNALDYFGIDNVKEISIGSLKYDEHMTEFIYLDIFPYDDMIRRKEKKGIRETFFQGYSNVKQFTSPNYSSVVLPDEKDFRRTLYWNPNVKTDKEGKASVGFYNNRMSNKIKIEVESFIK